MRGVLVACFCAFFSLSKAQSDSLSTPGNSKITEKIDKKFNLELSFMPLDLYKVPCYSYSSRQFSACNLGGAQMKAVFKQKHALRLSLQNYTVSGLYRPAKKTNQLIRLGYEKTLYKSSRVKCYFLTDIAYETSFVNTGKFYVSDRNVYSPYTKTVYDSLFKIAQTVRSCGILPGLGIKLFEPKGLFISVETSCGLSFFNQDVESQNIVEINKIVNGSSTTIYYKEHDTLYLNYKGVAFIANVVRVSFGYMF